MAVLTLSINNNRYNFSIEPFVTLASLARTTHNGEKIFRILLSAILDAINNTISSWQKISSGGGRIGRRSRRKYKQSRIRTWTILSSFVSKLFLPIVCQNNLGVVDLLDYEVVRKRLLEVEENASDVSVGGLLLLEAFAVQLNRNLFVSVIG